LRPLIIEHLLDAFPAIKSAKVSRAALWILGEYASTEDDIQAVMSQLRQTLGEVKSIFYSFNFNSWMDSNWNASHLSMLYICS
jgi:hypothetical protein